jgi:hypothetical protein
MAHYDANYFIFHLLILFDVLSFDLVMVVDFFLSVVVYPFFIIPIFIIFPLLLVSFIICFISCKNKTHLSSWIHDLYPHRTTLSYGGIFLYLVSPINVVMSSPFH